MHSLKRSMIDLLFFYLKEDLGVDPEQKVLLAVSGGMDSMCLWHLYRQAGLKYELVHCNFQLRGKESNDDEAFVKQYCADKEILHVKSFDTLTVAKNKGISIQMAARELRYDYFDQLLADQKINKLATAHHLDDEVETFFIQLIRRASLEALKGIPKLTKNRIRPLMFADRKMIVEYVHQNDVPYREDSSNKGDDYLRNRIRHHLMPAIDSISPGIRKKVLNILDEVNQVNGIVEGYVELNKNDIIHESDGTTHYSISAIMDLDFPELFLKHSLKTEGFNESTAEDIIKGLKGQSGKLFYGRNKKLLISRDELLIQETNDDKAPVYSMPKSSLGEVSGLPFEYKIIERSIGYQPSRSEKRVHLDYDRLQERIIFRKWKRGDAFIPLGMNGKKKISDYYTDLKLSRFEKEAQWLMFSGEELCWVVGRRLDDRYKVTANTKKILEINLG